MVLENFAFPDGGVAQRGSPRGSLASCFCSVLGAILLIVKTSSAAIEPPDAICFWQDIGHDMKPLQRTSVFGGRCPIEVTVNSRGPRDGVAGWTFDPRRRPMTRGGTVLERGVLG